MWVLYHYTGGDYSFTPYNYVTCRNVIGIRVERDLAVRGVGPWIS